MIPVLEPHLVTKALGLRGNLFMQFLKNPCLRSITYCKRLQMVVNDCAINPKGSLKDFIHICDSGRIFIRYRASSIVRVDN